MVRENKEFTLRTEATIGDAASLILDRSRESGVALVVLGTHGRGEAARFFLGSVAEAVVRGECTGPGHAGTRPEDRAMGGTVAARSARGQRRVGGKPGGTPVG